MASLAIKKIYIILAIIFLTIISGCTGTNTGNNPPADPRPAQNAISQAQSFMKNVQSDLSAATVPVNDAKSRGIDTVDSDILISNLQNELSDAANNLVRASNEFNARDYSNAKSDAELSIATLRGIQNQLGQIKQTIENDYKTTADKYKALLIDAEIQYLIGEKYMESAHDVGADIIDQKNSLQDIMNNLNQAKQSYRNNYYIGLSDQINKIVQSSQQIQQILIDKYYNALILIGINDAKSKITSKDAMILLSESTSLLTQKRYQEAVVALNKALIVENEIDAMNNIDKLKQSVNNMNLEVSFKMVDDILNAIHSNIANNDFDSARGNINLIRADISAIQEYSAKVADAGIFIDDTSNLRFWWADSPDTSSSSAKLNDAKRFLTQGDFKSAMDSKDDAINLASEERKLFWNRIKSDYLLGSLYRISNFIQGDPEAYKPKTVERVNFVWKSLPENINIDFSKPIADISNIVVEDPGSPILPTIQQPSTNQSLKKPIYFELNPGNPISCGTTCRQTTATLTNTGDDTAHNVRVNLNINNDIGEIIYSTQESLGDISGGQSISKIETINVDCGFLFSKCNGHMPFILKAEVLYDEGTQTFPDQQFSS